MPYYTVLRVVLLTAVCVKCVFCECVTPDSRAGECKSPLQCETIPFLKDRYRTREQTNYLREASCHTFKGLIQDICCPLPEDPNECVILGDVKGVCKEAINCPVVLSLRFDQAVHYLTPRCKSTLKDGVSVCCPTPTTVGTTTSLPTQPTLPTLPITQPTPTTTISTTSTTTTSSSTARSDTCLATALPPDPSSGCCGLNVASSRIVGGSETGIGQYPWLVLLEYRVVVFGGLYTKCGGSLISGKYVLTAAHCVHRKMTDPPVSVRLGEHDTRQNVDCEDEEQEICNNGSVSVPIANIIINPLYLPEAFSHNDIALVRLNQIVKFSEFVRPICLPTPSEADPSKLVVAGWGITETGHESFVKMHVMVPFVPFAACYRINPLVRIWEGQMCAGGEAGKDSCKGDSGGPLMNFRGTAGSHYYELLGIVSFGRRLCQLGRPGIYTKVTAYLQWISVNMRE